MKYVYLSDAALVLGVSPDRLRRLCLDGRIPGAQKNGRCWRLPAPVRISPAPTKHRRTVPTVLPIAKAERAGRLDAR